jgi:hypothetical protein
VYEGSVATIATIVGEPKSAAAIQKVEMPVSSLSTFERADQRKEFLQRAQGELRKVVSKADASKAMRHAAHSEHAFFDAVVRRMLLPSLMPLLCGNSYGPENVMNAANTLAQRSLANSSIS